MLTGRINNRDSIGRKFYGSWVVAVALVLACSSFLHAQSPLTVQPSTGRVGVGNTNPTETLEVTGTVKATSFKGDGSQLTNVAGGLLNKVTTNTVLTDATATETSLYSFSIPGGTLGTNSTVRLTLRGIVYDFNETGTVTLRIKYGSTTLSASLTLNGTPTVPTLPWQVVIELSGDGATNAQIMHGLATVERVLYFDNGCECNAYSGWSPYGGDNSKAVRGTSTVDSTAGQNLVVTGQWPYGGGSSSITLEYAMLEKLS